MVNRNGSAATAEFQKMLSQVLSPADSLDHMHALNKIIADHMRVDAANVPSLMALTSWPTTAHAQAAAMMLDRGLEQLSERDRKLFADGKLPMSKQPYPMALVVSLALNHISIDGRGRDDIVSAVTGFFVQRHGSNKGKPDHKSGESGVVVNVGDKK